MKTGSPYDDSVSRHRFNPEKAQSLLSEERKKLLDPEGRLINLGLCRGQYVLDFGCGPGFFTLPAARIVGRKGFVLAVDVSRKMLNFLSGQSDFSQIKLLHSDDISFQTKENIFDLALLILTLHELHNPQSFLAKIYNSLRTNATLFLIEWQKRETGDGPPVNHRLDMGDVLKMADGAGFRVEKQEDIQSKLYALTMRKRYA